MIVKYKQLYVIFHVTLTSQQNFIKKPLSEHKHFTNVSDNKTYFWTKDIVSSLWTVQNSQNINKIKENYK